MGSLIANLLARALRVGDRVRLRGENVKDPLWLGRGASHAGECVALVTTEGADPPCAVVRLDQPIRFDSFSGRVAILRLRHAGACWSRHEAVRVELSAALSVEEALGGKKGLWVESNARYLVVSP